jgi:hypothetical protein
MLPTLFHTCAHTCTQPLAVRKGAFVAGQGGNFHGKILYRYCRKPVYTPSDWDPSLADRSAELPDARLVLEFIYGYQGAAAAAWGGGAVKGGGCPGVPCFVWGAEWGWGG